MLKLLWKNSIKSLLSNKFEIFSIISLIFIITCLFVSFIGFRFFLFNQKENIDKKGHVSDGAISISADSLLSSDFLSSTAIGDYSIKDKNSKYNPVFSVNSSMMKIINTVFENSIKDGINKNNLSFNVQLNRLISSHNQRFYIDGILNYLPYYLKNKFSFPSFPSFPPGDSNFILDYYKDYWKTEYQKICESINENTEWNSNDLGDVNNYLKKPAIDSPILLSGRLPNNTFEIAVNPYFALTNHIVVNKFLNNTEITPEYLNSHNLKTSEELENYAIKKEPKSVIKIQDIKFVVTGIATDPKFIFPQIDQIDLIPNNAKQSIVYYCSDFFSKYFGSHFEAGLGSFDYSISFKINDVKKINIINSSISKTVNYFNNIDPKWKLQAVNYNDSSYLYYNRRNFILKISNLIKEILISFSLIIILISLFILLIILRKTINFDAKRIGILKAQGYNEWMISLSYIIFPFFGSFIGSFLGVFCSFFVWGLIIELFFQYFNFNLLSSFNISNLLNIFNNNILTILIAFFLPTIFSVTIAFTFVYVLVSKNIRQLIYESE